MKDSHPRASVNSRHALLVYASGGIGYLHKYAGENLSVICTSVGVITETRDRIHNSTKNNLDPYVCNGTRVFII